MKVLMLGWEYPPNITGGLATASEGLSKALAAQGIAIDFILPRRTGQEDAKHMSIFACHEVKNIPQPAPQTDPATGEIITEESEILRKNKISTKFYSSYSKVEAYTEFYDRVRVSNKSLRLDPHLPSNWFDRNATEVVEDLISSNAGRDGMFQEVIRYARDVVFAAKTRAFDVVHAHDWMTVPAGILVAQAAGVPLVLHVHSLEYDRCGDGGNALIHAIEGLGVRSANRVIAVSDYTRDMICAKHRITPEKIRVAHNGVEVTVIEEEQISVVAESAEPKPPKKKRILFLGRVTFQKGPDLFVETASLVLKHNKNVVFVVAGAGDMMPKIRKRVKELKLEGYFEFPGFLKGAKLDEEFKKADLYVMPSVSEPFGIAPLEAISRGTPAIITKQSGVSEVLSHVLKSDFWDVKKMADFILNFIQHPELGRSMMAMSKKEVKRVRWDDAAHRVVDVYREVV